MTKPRRLPLTTMCPKCHRPLVICPDKMLDAGYDRTFRMYDHHNLRDSQCNFSLYMRTRLEDVPTGVKL